MLFNIKNYNINSISLTNLVFAFFPLSFIFGSLFVNINFILFSCLGIYHLRFKIFTTKFYFPLKIIFLFFLIVIISTSVFFIKSLYFSGYDYDNFIRFTKSIIFLRYFLLLVIIYLLNENDILSFEYFFYSGAFAAFFLSLDVIGQHIFGSNIIGLKSAWIYNSSLFGEERIAGGYITRFSIFSIFFLGFFLKEKPNIKFIFTIFIICILGTGIISSGNRMPLALFLIGLAFIFLLKAGLKKIILISILSLFIIFKFIIFNDPQREKNYAVFIYYGKQILFGGQDSFGRKFEENKNKSIEGVDEKDLVIIKTGHEGLFLTAIDTWNLNKVLGGGIKSFRVDCWKILKTKKLYRLCSTHPHNYYLEILTETGVVGLLSIISIILLILTLIFKNLKYFKGNALEEFVYLAASTSLIMEMFPIKSTGSFFTTNNATYIILILSIFLSITNKINKKYNKSS